MIYPEELQQFEYKNVLKYFCEISSVPRGSGYNSLISRFLTDFAIQNGLQYRTDEAENVIIYKPATPGYEHIPPVILQGHMDMVCVKTNNCSHDFEKDGLDLFYENGLLGAHGTTLGGDDGIALAYAMALLTDETLEHPALEFVATTDEETGLFGAKAIDATMLKGKYMINVDSEDEGVVLVSCAGGLRVTGMIDITRRIAEGIEVDIHIRGLKGGHSGSEIDKNRTNAIAFLGRLLYYLESKTEFYLKDICGGEKDNAIPDSATAKVVVSESNIQDFLCEIEESSSALKHELAASEPGLTVSITQSNEGMFSIIHPDNASQLIMVLMIAPNGVLTMSSEIDGLVESSVNLGVLKVHEKYAEFHYSVRSSKTTYKHYTRERIHSLFRAVGGRSEDGAEYPAWEYKAESVLRNVYKKAYYELNTTEPVFKAIHAGLECGIFTEKIPELDIISIGPDMQDIHTTKERLSVLSSINVYKSIERVLTCIKNTTNI